MYYGKSHPLENVVCGESGCCNDVAQNNPGVQDSLCFPPDTNDIIFAIGDSLLLMGDLVKHSDFTLKGLPEH